MGKKIGVAQNIGKVSYIGNLGKFYALLLLFSMSKGVFALHDCFRPYHYSGCSYHLHGRYLHHYLWFDQAFVVSFRPCKTFAATTLGLFRIA